MTAGELKRELEEYDDNTEVRLMMQPNYPFEYSIGHISDMRAIDENYEQENIIYLCEGSQLGYGKKAAFDY